MMTFVFLWTKKRKMFIDFFVIYTEFEIMRTAKNMFLLVNCANMTWKSYREHVECM